MIHLFKLLCISLIGLIPNLVYTQNNHDPITVAFVIKELSFRGIEVSTFDYADFNESILGNKSIIINFDVQTDNEVRKKFSNRFGNKFFDCCNVEDMDYILAQENVTILYHQKPGHNDGIISKVCNNVVHVVFPQIIEPHGDVYAFISEWFTHEFPHLNLPFVPYMVRVDQTNENLRKELNIPQDALVFGRHGGAGSFNVLCAQEAVKEVAQKRPDIFFLFLNTDEFCHLPNVIFLPKTTNMQYKAKFINTCDAMIHGRWRGETFGLACAEFSIKNKPVITWIDARERAHIQMLGEKALYYANKEQLVDILLNFKKDQKNWDAYSQDYQPATVMKKFDEIFIQPFKGNSCNKGSKILQFKAIRTKNGSLNTLFFEQLKTVLNKSTIITESEFESFLNNPHNFESAIILFNFYERQATTEHNHPSIIAQLQRLIATNENPPLIIDGIHLINNQTIETLCMYLSDNGYRVFINQTSIIAFIDADILIDPFIRAMTISFFCQFNDFAKTILIHDLLNAEQLIGKKLCDPLVRQEFDQSEGMENFSTLLWRGLASLQNQNYKKAADFFKQLIDHGVHHWRLYWYQGQSLYKMGSIKAEEVMVRVLQQNPQFPGIQEFKKIINA